MVSGLNQYYGESHTLWDLDFTVRSGRCTCIMGRNGVGKTTLMQSLMGLLPIRSGKICYHNRDLASLGAEQRAASGIAYVPQGRQIFPLLTVEENIRTGLFASRVTAASRQLKKSRGVPLFVYELFPVLQQMRHRRGGDLSGGQLQQLALARALVLNPSLLLLDEPTEGIQPNIVQEIGSVVRRLTEEFSITVLLVEQKLPFARRVADDYLILDRGRLVAQGLIDQLDEHTVERYLTV